MTSRTPKEHLGRTETDAASASDHGLRRRTPDVRKLRHHPADRPFIVIWEATQVCPLACHHCRASARPHLGLKVQINTTVTRRTVDDLPAIAAQVHDRGVMLWSVFFLVPTGRGRTLAGLDAAETEDVLNILYDLGETVPVKTTTSGASACNAPSSPAVAYPPPTPSTSGRCIGGCGSASTTWA